MVGGGEQGAGIGSMTPQAKRSIGDSHGRPIRPFDTGAKGSPAWSSWFWGSCSQRQTTDIAAMLIDVESFLSSVPICLLVALTLLLPGRFLPRLHGVSRQLFLDCASISSSVVLQGSEQMGQPTSATHPNT